MAKFVSVIEGYQKWQKLESFQWAAGLVGAGMFLTNTLPLVGIGLVVLAWLVDSARRKWQKFFWNQAMGLHSSKLEGQPDILQHLKPHHQREFNKRARAKFMA